MYADNTVLIYANRDARVIQDMLVDEAARVASWIRDSNLELNLKKGKTELVLYGSHQKLSKQPKCEITINDAVINEVTSYNYLGVSLDSHLTLQEHISNIYRKCSAKVKLLSRNLENFK